ncbi:hypothetical protein RirG_000580 [Rhizophagus irregularis DAOM 197198w]|uniref:Uncharacterized protein n=1 Tax=Rhizophagus irregularis (strain DAOM 197198w) TaxID=1432141 RepID=A0A015LJ74_RHIIW|nr:hypothetical protein RirG_002380 [Rhizophagus irregularis DAOM 197198w]EXX79959.1 hypothetical protein RirG_000580 [Rhizophagus irregularis DAOM 197198w]
MKISYTLILAINLALFTASSVATPIGNIGNGVIISPPPPPDGPKGGPKGHNTISYVSNWCSNGTSSEKG